MPQSPQAPAPGLRKRLVERTPLGGVLAQDRQEEEKRVYAGGHVHGAVSLDRLVDEEAAQLLASSTPSHLQLEEVASDHHELRRVPFFFLMASDKTNRVDWSV